MKVMRTLILAALTLSISSVVACGGETVETHQDKGTPTPTEESNPTNPSQSPGEGPTEGPGLCPAFRAGCYELTTTVTTSEPGTDFFSCAAVGTKTERFQIFAASPAEAPGPSYETCGALVAAVSPVCAQGRTCQEAGSGSRRVDVTKQVLLGGSTFTYLQRRVYRNERLNEGICSTTTKATLVADTNCAARAGENP